MKKISLLAVILSLCVLLAACGTQQGQSTDSTQTGWTTRQADSDAVSIVLSDSGVTVGGKAATSDSSESVYVNNDIVFYLEGQGFTYGEGEEKDEHSQSEADAHTVVHITEAGEYVISGCLSAGQIAVDLGKDAADDPNAVVTLVLDNADITCTVAPAVIFYNVYECGSKDEETAAMEVDTSDAGANVVIADGSENNISGSYVARIYKSVELDESGTKVVDSKKLHKYDAAFYSKKTMNIYGEEKNSGVLNIFAENEGLDSELHLTIFSGNINIRSGNDGINTNEDNVSVTHILGGVVNITVDGSTGEGDGIDSNGWLVIDGGTVNAYACGFSGDSGIDADKGVYVRSGQVVATGNMYDRVVSEQTSAVFSFALRQSGGNEYSLCDESGKAVLTCTPANDFQYLYVSAPRLAAGNYTFRQGDKLLKGTAGRQHMGDFMGGFHQGNPPEMPEGMERPEMPEGMTPPEEMERPEMPEGMTPPEGMERPEKPEGMTPPEGFGGGAPAQETSELFAIAEGENTFEIS